MLACGLRAELHQECITEQAQLTAGVGRLHGQHDSVVRA